VNGAMRAITLVVLLFACGGSHPPPAVPVFDCTKDDCESCTKLSQKLGWSKLENDHCALCQGNMATPDDCADVPVRGGAHVIRGCNTDSDCHDVSPFCASHTGWPQNTCTLNDAV
jgi:hypothetical protein